MLVQPVPALRWQSVCSSPLRRRASSVAVAPPFCGRTGAARPSAHQPSLGAAVAAAIGAAQLRKQRWQGPGLARVLRCADFGGVYPREWAQKPDRSRQPESSWLWFPGLAFALAVAWQAFHNWTDVLIALNIVSFLIQCYSPTWEDTGVLTGDTLQTPQSSHRLVSSSFLHASWYHLGANMYSLWYLGRPAERVFGPGRFLFVYLMSAFSCALASLWSKRGRRDSLPSVGASGGVFGVMAAMLVFRWRHGIPCAELWLMLLLNLALGLMSPQVDDAGHIGGAAAGALTSFLWGPRWVWSLGGMLIKDVPIIRWPFV